MAYSITEQRKKLERREARLIRQNRWEEAQVAALQGDALWDIEHPGAAERRERWQAAQVEQDARNRCAPDSDDIHAHDPR